MRNKFVYSCSIKICVSGFDKFLESIFCILLVMEAFFSAKSGQGAWRHLLPTSLTWWEVRWTWQIEAELLSSICSTFEALVCNVQSGFVTEKNWALSVDQCWLQVLAVFIDLLSILLWCKGFATIQKAIVDQMGSRLPNSDHDFFFWCKFGFGKCFGTSSWSGHWAGHRRCHIQCIFCRMSQSDWEMIHCCVE